MSTKNTVIAEYPWLIDGLYDNVTASWNTTFEHVDDFGWDPYLDFGDIASLTDVNTPDSLYTYTFSLWAQSCWDGDIQNCTSVCTDPELLFARPSQGLSSRQQSDSLLDIKVPYNVLACMYYPMLSKLLGMVDHSDESWKDLVGIGEQYNIVANASAELIQEIVDIQVTCYRSYCYTQNEDLCDNFDPDTGNYQALTAPGLLPLFPDWSTISPSSTMRINSDIGGIGVSIAYIVQFGIIIIMWLSLRCLRLSRRYAKKHPPGPETQQTLLRKSTVRRSPNGLQKAFRKLTKRMQNDLTELLTHFHEAQCWFFIPLNLTVLIGICGSASVFGTKSLGQLARNMTYAQCVTQGGIVTAIATMYFVLFEVHFCEDVFKDETDQKHTGTSISVCSANKPKHTMKELKKAFVLWGLTFISVSLGTAAWYLSFDVSKPEHLIDAIVGSNKTFWAPACGIISPATYNGERWTADEWTHKNHKMKRLPIIFFNWALLIAMFIYCLSNASFWHRLTYIQRIKPRVQFLAFSTHRWVRRTFLCLIEMAVLTCLGFFLKDYITLMRPNLSTIDKTFTMGQLLATFVWATTIVGAYYLLCDWIIAISKILSHESDHEYQMTAYEGHQKLVSTQVWEVK